MQRSGINRNTGFDLLFIYIRLIFHQTDLKTWSLQHICLLACLYQSSGFRKEKKCLA